MLNLSKVYDPFVVRLAAILPDKDYEFNEDEPEGIGINFEVGQNH